MFDWVNVFRQMKIETYTNINFNRNTRISFVNNVLWELNQNKYDN